MHKERKGRTMKSIWIARGKNGSLYLHEEKPYRKGDVWMYRHEHEPCKIDDGWFPEITWESEPMELVIKEKAIDALDTVLDNWVHGGDEDYIIAEFERELNKEKEG